MVAFCENMLEIAFELAAHDPTYEELATNYGVHLLLIARAMNGIGPDGMWDEEDGFYYYVLRLPDGSATRLKVRSMVGLLPLCATTAVDRWQRERVPKSRRECTSACGACRSSAKPSIRPDRATSAWRNGE
jgi:hypothetical protein